MMNGVSAIRQDRMRGGRSSYSGCSPHGRAAAGHTPSPPSHVKSSSSSSATHKYSTTASSRVIHTNSDLMSGGDYPHKVHIADNIVTVINTNETDCGTSTSGLQDYNPESVQPQTPQVLDDLVTLESLMNEDDGEQECCKGKLRAGDTDLFGSLLHIADHCLYRIVRWARNLPQFADISVSICHRYSSEVSACLSENPHY